MTEKEAFADFYGLDPNTLTTIPRGHRRAWTNSEAIAVLVEIESDQRTGQWAANINVACPICHHPTLRYDRVVRHMPDGTSTGVNRCLILTHSY